MGEVMPVVAVAKHPWFDRLRRRLEMIPDGISGWPRVLVLPAQFSKEEAQKVYRKLCIVAHPDKNPGMEKVCNEMMNKLNDAVVTAERLATVYKEPGDCKADEILANQFPAQTWEEAV